MIEDLEVGWKPTWLIVGLSGRFVVESLERPAVLFFAFVFLFHFLFGTMSLHPVLG